MVTVSCMYYTLPAMTPPGNQPYIYGLDTSQMQPLIKTSISNIKKLNKIFGCTLRYSIFAQKVSCKMSFFAVYVKKTNSDAAN